MLWSVFQIMPLGGGPKGEHAEFVKNRTLRKNLAPYGSEWQKNTQFMIKNRRWRRT